MNKNLRWKFLLEVKKVHHQVQVIFTARIRSMGKVMFSHTSVTLSTGGGGAPICIESRGVYPAGLHPGGCIRRDAFRGASGGASGVYPGYASRGFIHQGWVHPGSSSISVASRLQPRRMHLHRKYAPLPRSMHPTTRSMHHPLEVGTVNRRAVRILLECVLVHNIITIFVNTTIFWQQK